VNLLNVDANNTVAGHGEHGKVTGVRKIEFQPAARQISAQRGFPLRAIAKLNAPPTKGPSGRNEKKGCAQGQDYGFISVVKTGGAVNLPPEPD